MIQIDSSLQCMSCTACQQKKQYKSLWNLCDHIYKAPHQRQMGAAYQPMTEIEYTQAHDFEANVTKKWNEIRLTRAETIGRGVAEPAEVHEINLHTYLGVYLTMNDHPIRLTLRAMKAAETLMFSPGEIKD